MQLLLVGDYDVDFAGDFGVELYVNCVCAVCLDGTRHNDLALVDFDLVLCEKCFCAEKTAAEKTARS